MLTLTSSQQQLWTTEVKLDLSRKVYVINQSSLKKIGDTQLKEKYFRNFRLCTESYSESL